MADLKAASSRVQSFLENHGKQFKVLQLPASTRTAVEAAKAVGCSQAQIAKSLIFREPSTDQAILIIASGINRVAIEKVQSQTGITLAKADADFVRAKTGYAIGGVPPVAHSQPVTTILDRDLLQYQTLWAAAGTPNSVFELRPADLPELTGGDWLDIKE